MDGMSSEFSSSMGQPMLGVSVELRNVSKLYGNFSAVNDISIVIRKGEFVTLLGPSGSGKTTTLMMIAGFIMPTSGDILLDGKSINIIPPYKRNLGMVFQNYALFPHMTVFDNIAFPLKMRKISTNVIKDKVYKVLEQVEMSGFANRYPRQLSGGQQQRIALARAIVFDPPLILMDEPLGALDKKLREHMQLEIKHLQKQLGLTVLYVTHDQSEALIMSDVIIIMNQGKIEQFGLPDEIYNTPKTKFVADFIGETNIIKGTIKEILDYGYRIVGKKMDITIHCKDDLSINQEIYLSVRPERTRLGELGKNQGNGLIGIVDEIIYLGEVIKYNLKSTSDLSIVSKQLNNGMEKPFKKGDKVFIHWNPEDCVVISS